MPGPGDEGTPVAAGRGRQRVSRLDREQAIELLKVAFVHDRLTQDELDTRVGLALASRTYADLAALTAGIPASAAVEPAAVEPAAAEPAAAERAVKPVATPARTLGIATRRAGICLLKAAAALPWSAAAAAGRQEV